MPRTCTICKNNNRNEIDKMLIEGVSFRNIAKQCFVSISSLYRHKIDHLPSKLIKAKDAELVTHADNLLNEIEDLRQKALNILNKAEKGKDYRAATSAIREARGCLELLARLLGELKDKPSINITINPEWVIIRNTILNTLEPYPEAKKAISSSLEELNESISK